VWLSYGDGNMMFDLEWCFLGRVVVMSGYGYHFQRQLAMEYDLGDDVYFGGCCPRWC